MVELVSVHVPKTAGTAFRYVLLDIYSAEAVLEDYPPDRIYQPQQPLSPKIRVIHGHFKPEKYQGYYPEAKRIVWLRHPIFRLISEYFFAKTIKDRNNVIHARLLDQNLSILEFAKIGGMRDVLTASIQGMTIDQFDFVGIQEFYLEDLVELKQIFGWRDFTASVRNSNSYPDYDRYQQEILCDTALMNQLAKLNQADMELYDCALKLRAKRRNESVFLQYTLSDWRRSQHTIQHTQQRLQQLQQQIQQYKSILHPQRPIQVKINPVSKQTLKEQVLYNFEQPATVVDLFQGCITLSGWVVGKQQPAIALRLIRDRQVVVETPVNLPRPDVKQVYPLPGAENSGFELQLVAAVVAARHSLVIQAVLGDRSTITIGSIDSKPLATLSV